MTLNAIPVRAFKVREFGPWTVTVNHSAEPDRSWSLELRFNKRTPELWPPEAGHQHKGALDENALNNLLEWLKAAGLSDEERRKVLAIIIELQEWSHEGA